MKSNSQKISSAMKNKRSVDEAYNDDVGQNLSQREQLSGNKINENDDEAAKQKKSNETIEPAKKSAILAKVNGPNDTDAVKSTASKQKKSNKAIEPAKKSAITDFLPQMVSFHNEWVIINDRDFC